MQRGSGAIAVLALAVLLASVPTTHAHPGGLDKHGCHTNRKTGDYHCHRDGAPTPAAFAAPAPTPSPASATPSRPHDRSPARAFRNCDEARAHGAAPVRRGDPGYGPHLDRDNDGIGCEPYRAR
jgi:hypothetical protein